LLCFPFTVPLCAAKEREPWAASAPQDSLYTQGLLTDTSFCTIITCKAAAGINVRNYQANQDTVHQFVQPGAPRKDQASEDARDQARTKFTELRIAAPRPVADLICSERGNENKTKE
jgi:hypothetical protein